ncbi:hypothetical protein HYW87_00860 [Candidatus Roizmanbacteria bacterium]|nr:hypothetical protein [Candidatus Roizmanbacteria bacterium]
MKRETTIAILLGMLLGGLVAVVIIVKNRQQLLGKTKTIAPISKTGVNPTVNAFNYQNLELSDPQDGQIFEKNSMTIKGKVDPGSLITIQSPIKDLVFKNEKKDFSTEFPLALGENTITVTAYSKKAQFNPQEKKLKVYFIKKEL